LTPLMARGVREAAIVVSAASREMRGQLRALAWVTLEEVALDTVVEDGRMVARTSARQVADRLRVDPGTVAGALRSLRERGLVALERDRSAAGRFGLSVYLLRPPAGLTVVGPGAAHPCVVSPGLVTPHVDGADRFRTPGVAGRGNAAPSSASLQCPGQESLDLELES
jgi:DNA-binding transcriptional ArsR family regulator